MEKEYFAYRFGFMAVKKGFATPEEISQAFEVQFEENVSTNTHRRIGEILVDMGVINTSQFDEVLEAMSQKE